MTAHSVVGASSMYRWTACPGSVNLSKGVENKSSSYAEEGTLAHDLAAQFLEKRKWPKIDLEMKAYLEIYVHAVLDENADQMWVEHQFDLSEIFPGMFGTADCVLYFKAKKKLSVWDLKYGAGIPVEAEDSQQLMFYALGALMTLHLPCDTVEVVIAQPRCPHPEGEIRRWSFPAINLLDFAADAKDAAIKTQDPNAPLVAGDHCRFCPAAGFCPALKEQALTSASQQFSSLLPYDKAELGRMLSVLPTVAEWIKNVREFAYREMQKGVEIPGWKLVAKRATRKWNDTDEIVATALINKGANSESLWDKSLKSPAQLEKILGKDTIIDFVSSVSSGQTIAELSDRRPAAVPAIEAEFSVIED